LYSEHQIKELGSMNLHSLAILRALDQF